MFAVPIALLFAVAYGLGSFYAQGELLAMFGAGASLRRLVQPLVALAALLSGALFLFEDEVAIHALRMKNQLYRTALDIRIRLDDANLALASPDRRVITHADFYDDDLVELTRVLVLERAADGTVTTRLDAERAQWDGAPRDGAQWDGGQWVFEGVRRFIWNEAGGIREGTVRPLPRSRAAAGAGGVSARAARRERDAFPPRVGVGRGGARGGGRVPGRSGQDLR